MSKKKPDERQLRLPFKQLRQQEGPKTEDIIRRLTRASRILHLMKLDPSELVDKISQADRFWKRMVVKKGTKTRICYQPHPKLWRIHIRIKHYLRRRFEKKVQHYNGFFPATAFERGNSIIRNASYHYGNQSSLVLDLKDAFSSIKTKHVYRWL